MGHTLFVLAGADIRLREGEGLHLNVLRQQAASARVTGCHRLAVTVTAVLIL